MARARGGFLWAMAPQVPRTASIGTSEPEEAHHPARCQRALAEAQPRGGVTRDRVTRPSGRLAPSRRQAPAGHTEGGNQSTASRKSNRRYYWLRLFHYGKLQRYYADLKKLLPTLDIGSHSNAALQARGAAEAT